jgi:basic membrane protein A
MIQFAPHPAHFLDHRQLGPYYIRRVGEAMEGTWEQSDTWEGMPEGMVVIGEMTDAIPEEVRASATALMESIARASTTRSPARSTGRTAPPGWPKARSPKTARSPGMGFYVEGLTGEIPN